MKEFLQLRIKKVIHETANAITLILGNVDGTPVTYQAGQFLTFLLTIHGRELRRSYSLSSTPGIDADIAVTIVRVENGEVSRYLIDNLKAGDILVALHPTGRFIVDIQPDMRRDIFLIGAGSGITPLFSILKQVLKEEPLSHITLINSNKNETTALFWQQLNELQTQYSSQLTSIHLFSNPTSSNLYPVRLNIARLQQLVQEHLTFEKDKARFFICGPGNFMRMVRMTLVFMEIDENNIHKENFVTTALPEISTPVSLEAPPKRVTVQYLNREHIFEVPYYQTILKAALDQRIQLPYSCMGGVCSTCSGLCISGSVKMAVNEVLTDKEVAQGWVLPCVSYPLSDNVVIRINFSQD